MLEESVRHIDEILRTADGDLSDAVRLRLGLERIVGYFRAAERQYQRIGEYLYEPIKRIEVPKRFPLDQGAALCEAHFLFICWNSIFKVMSNMRRNVYGITAPRVVLKAYKTEFAAYQRARNHLEHLPERYPGQPASDWTGDSNSITGTVAGIRRDGVFLFQKEEWDITETSLATLRTLVTEFITLARAEVDERLVDYHNGESAMRAPRTAR